ncbi:hypothetical protein DUNSADRAFT_592 [Dunaliella salina]|uniref:Uncharacterized protein n=1 Tax=Dunaliella salina TaxID=3046 RepID=A0ABQ7GY47_DUNSA|nr:hypothetical protein DUNSADRAFT_592 [Dunaliella salina]|eukprot:KAF5839521.1 hypothetical protein DUNSADRAFT_592 [Dunaliella salina]
MAGAAAEPLESISLIGRGLTSCSQVPELQHPTLTSVCLHGNDITSTEGISHLTRLQHLNLSSNAVNSLEGVQGLPSLTTLNLSSNRLAGALPPLRGLPNLTHLNLSYNGLTSLQGLHALLSHSPPTAVHASHLAPLPHTHPLRKLNLKHNLISSVQAFGVLVHFPALQELSLGGNPVCMQPTARQQLLTLLPQLATLDNTPSHNITAAALGPPSPTLPPPPLLPPPQPWQQQPQQKPQQQYQQQYQQHTHAASAAHAVGQPPAQTAPPPQLPQPLPHPHQPAHFILPAPSPAPFHPQQQQHQQQQQEQQRQPQNLPVYPYQQPLSQHEQQPPFPEYRPFPPHPHPHQRSHAQQQLLAPGQQQGWQDARATGEVDNHHLGAHHLGAGLKGGRGPDAPVPINNRSSKRAQGHIQNQGQAGGAHSSLVQGSVQGPGQPPARALSPPPAVRKVVYLVDAAVQASDSRAAARMQSEVEQLRAQLAEMTGELERRTRVDREAQRQISNILQAGEEDAQQRVEEGFREASQAVSKALHEVDVARRAALEAEERVGHAQLEKQAAQMQADALRQQLQRLQQDACQAAEAREAEAGRAMAALQDELKRAAQSEADLKQELQNAQQQASLQQSSSTAVTLTARIAQAMSDGDTQANALRAKLAAAEQAAQGASSREHELLGRIKVLTETSASAAQQHAKELEQVRQQAALDAAAARAAEGKAAEERGRLCMAAQAEQERSALQEQLTYLKVQLQFALEESDKERAGIQGRLDASEHQVATLTAAAQEAAQKGRVFEELVTDLSNVVSQQKLHIQGLQKEREALAGQLRSSGPEQLQRLSAQLAAAKGAAADAEVMRDQAEVNRQRWQEAERRIVEQQIKMAMLDSAHDTVASLKAELEDYAAEAEEARRAAEEVEGQAAQQAEADAQEKASLRSELVAGESALESMSQSVNEAQAKLKEAEERAREAEQRLKTVEEQLQEKSELIKYVEEEVERVKGLFEKREGRVREERDAAQADAERARKACGIAEVHLAEAAARGDTLAAELHKERQAAAAALEASARAQAEADRLSIKLAEVEGEMRTLLDAVERQKLASVTKMRQLASFLTDLG